MLLGTKQWILAGHLIGVILWIASMTATYWLLRIHEHAPNDARDRLTAMERSLALTMDIAATLAIGCTGGKHRSVAIAEQIARDLSATGLSTQVVHRDLGRE